MCLELDEASKAMSLKFTPIKSMIGLVKHFEAKDNLAMSA